MKLKSILLEKLPGGVKAKMLSLERSRNTQWKFTLRLIDPIMKDVSMRWGYVTTALNSEDFNRKKVEGIYNDFKSEVLDNADEWAFVTNKAPKKRTYGVRQVIEVEVEAIPKNTNQLQKPIDPKNPKKEPVVLNTKKMKLMDKVRGIELYEKPYKYPYEPIKTAPKKTGTGKGTGTGTGTGPEIGDKKEINGKLHVWDGTKWVSKTDIFTITGKRGETGTDTSKYKVVSGDTLSKIAKKHGMTLDNIIQLNPQIQDINKIFPGQLINVSGEPVDKEKEVDVDKEKEVDEAKPIILSKDYLYKQLESKFPNMFRGDGGVQNRYKLLYIGLTTYGKTYEGGLKRALANPTFDVDERALLNMFKSLSRNELATFFKRYKDINGTELYADLDDTTFDTSEMNEFLRIIQSKSLNIGSKSKSLVFKNKQDKLQFVQ